MPDFVNDLLSMGVFCDADCTVTFTKKDVTVYNAHGTIILWVICESSGAKMWQINLTTATANNSSIPTPAMRPSIIPDDNDEEGSTNWTQPQQISNIWISCQTKHHMTSHPELPLL